MALDTSSLGEAVAVVKELKSVLSFFKVGLELLTKEGAPQVVKAIQAEGVQVFYDGKFSDIPNTVGQASKNASDLGVELFNVHANCGLESIRAAAKNKGGSKLLAVTVLTSISIPDVHNKVLEYARLAKEGGADGVVCSPQELHLFKTEEFKGFLKVTPGVRPTWASANDQKRVMTPKEALEAGADYLVIGRPITQPPKEVGSRLDAAKKIIEELNA